MFKYINDGELDKLKKGFYITLALKKINIFNINKFMSKDLTLNNATKIYKSIATLKFPTCYSNCSAVMLDYLVEYNLLEKDEFNKITKVFRGDSEIENDEYIEYGDYSEERSDYVLEFLKKLGSEKGIEIYSETFRDIIDDESEYIDLNIYGELRNTLRDHMSSFQDSANSTEEDWQEEYYNIFQDDATSYVLKDYVMTDNELMLLNNTFTSADSGVLSEAYTNNVNTYINISCMQAYDGLPYSLLIILKLIFMNNN